MKKFLAILPLLLSIPYASAIPLAGENIYISLPPESSQCIDIRIPDDLGAIPSGLHTYNIQSNAQWGDITEQEITTDENNSVRVPLCFLSFGKKIGECSPSYSLSIVEKSLNIAKSFEGAVCISEFADVDYPAAKGDNPKEVINTNADMFDIAFKNPVSYVLPEEQGTFTVLLESYAKVTLELSSQTLLPERKTIVLSKENPNAAVEFTAQNEGEVSITAAIQGCQGNFCSKKATGEVKTLQTLNLTGFSVEIFPRSLDVKNLDPIKYQLIITNYEKEDAFTVDLILPEGLKTNFQKQVLSISQEKTIEFEVIPTNASTLYLMTAIVAAGKNAKTVSSVLSTNELLTDASRAAGEKKEENPERSEEIDKSLESWYESYKTKEYGEDVVNDYEKFQESLKEIQEPVPDRPSVESPIETPQDNNIIFIIAIVGVVVAILVVVMIKKPKSQKDQINDIEF